MNALSWLIYFADVFGKLSPLAFLLGSGLLGGGILVLVIAMLARGDAMSNLRWTSLYPEAQSKARIDFWEKVVREWPKKLIGFGTVILTMASFLPNRNTIYMIAASEMGEKVVTAPETRELFNDLRAVVSQQLKKMRDDK